MDKDQQEHKKFLEQQFRWTEDQIRILDEIDANLYEMKAIAEYASSKKLTQEELERLNEQLNALKDRVQSLEKLLHSVIH